MSAKDTPEWYACVGDIPKLMHDGKRAYYPHVHAGPRDGPCSDPPETYRSADGRDYRSHSRNSFTVNWYSINNDRRKGEPGLAPFDRMAELIVRAVNAHEELVEALTNLRYEAQNYTHDDLGAPRPLLLELLAAAHRALEKATGNASIQPAESEY